MGADPEAAAADVTAVTQNNAGGDNVSLMFLHRWKRGNADCTASISTGPSTAQILVHSHAHTQMLQWMARKEYSWRQLHRSSQITAGKFVVTLFLSKFRQLLHMEARSSSGKSVFVKLDFFIGMKVWQLWNTFMTWILENDHLRTGGNYFLTVSFCPTQPGAQLERGFLRCMTIRKHKLHPVELSVSWDLKANAYKGLFKINSVWGK